MKKLNSEKGFTLIELLAVIIILAVIMTVAIPNIISTLEKNKKDSFVKDAKQAVISCDYTIKTEKKYEYPDDTTAVVFPLTKIKNLNLETSSYDTYYSQNDSFVVITKNKVGSTYEYAFYVHLVSCTDELCENLEDNSSTKNRGINLVKSTALDEGTRFDLVVKGNEVNLNLLRDSTGQYANLKTQINILRQQEKDTQFAITDIVVY